MSRILKRLKERRGSEIIQMLIVLAIMGAIALRVTTGIGSTLTDANNQVMDSLTGYVLDSLDYGEGGGSGSN